MTTLSTALINTLGVATWYILGIAYTSLASHYWPKEEEFRGKWTPWDVYHMIRTHRDFSAYQYLPSSMVASGITLGFFLMLTVWPQSVFFHARRKFRTEPSNPDT